MDREREMDLAATVGDVIDYLKKTYTGKTKLCWIDCVEGVKYDVHYMTTEQLGIRFFRYIGEERRKIATETQDENEIGDYYYRFADNDILVR